MSDTPTDADRTALLPPPTEVPVYGVGVWSIEAVHQMLTVLNTEVLHLLDCLPTEGHDTDPTGTSTCTACAPHLAALKEHQRRRAALIDYLTVRIQAAHCTLDPLLEGQTRRLLAEAAFALRGPDGVGRPAPEGL